MESALAPAPVTASDPAPRSPGGRVGRALAAVLPFLLIAAVIAVRFPASLLRAEFWAEDATEFFFGSISLGSRAFVIPVYGYHFLLERLIAWAATFLPVYDTPYVYAWACLTVDAAALGYLARDGFSWILSRRWQRVALAMLIAAGPGTADIFLNLANLPNPLALLAFLLLVERPFRMSGWRLALFALAAASSGHALLWFPIAAYLAWTQRSRGYAVSAAILVCVAVLNVVGADAASRSAGSLSYGAIAVVPEILVENAFARGILGPFLGLEVAARIRKDTLDGVYWALVLGGLPVFAWLAFRRARADRDGTVVLVLGCIGAIGMLGLVAISRSYNIPQLVRDSGSLLPLVRYSFLPAALASLTWMSWLIGPAAPRRVPGTLRWGLALVLAFHLATLAPLHYVRPDLSWELRAPRVQALLDEQRATGRHVFITIGDLPIHPVGWIPDNGRIAVVVSGR